MYNVHVELTFENVPLDTNGIRALDLDSGKKRIGGSPKIVKTADSGEKKKKKKSKKKKA